MSRFDTGESGRARSPLLALLARWRTAWLLWLVAGVALPAGACPRCYESYSGAVLNTYYLSTAMLSLLPFAVVGVIVLVARRLVLTSRRLARHAGAGDAPHPGESS